FLNLGDIWCAHDKGAGDNVAKTIGSLLLAVFPSQFVDSSCGLAHDLRVLESLLLQEREYGLAVGTDLRMGVLQIVAGAAQTEGPYRLVGLNFFFHQALDGDGAGVNLKARRATPDEIACRRQADEQTQANDDGCQNRQSIFVVRHGFSPVKLEKVGNRTASSFVIRPSILPLACAIVMGRA